jgi:hypothetical protein
MNEKRKVYAPFSLTSEAGVAQTPVEGYIDVIQTVFPSVTTGTINENGKWTGVKSDDLEFKGFTKDLVVANGAEIAVPTGPTAADNFIDMTGFKNMFIAFKPTRAGDIRIDAIMGPSNSETRFANLTPVAAGEALRGLTDPRVASFGQVLLDTAETLVADVWNIFIIGTNRLEGQKNLQFKITNNSGGNSDIEFAYMRLV